MSTVMVNAAGVQVHTVAINCFQAVMFYLYYPSSSCFDE